MTKTDGVRTGKRLIRQEVTRRPVTRVIAVGTKPVRQCDANYSGACVPTASDVDCAGRAAAMARQDRGQRVGCLTGTRQLRTVPSPLAAISKCPPRVRARSCMLRRPPR